MTIAKTVTNPWRGTGLPDLAPMPSADSGPVARLLAHCPAHAVTPLVSAPDLARACGVARLSLKDERARMNLGSFKALGAAFVIADAAAHRRTGDTWHDALTGMTYATASAGNHGLSVAAGARIFGARSVVFLSETVPASFADRLRAAGADVVRAGATYEDSMTAAAETAEREGWTLLSDSSWPGYTELPGRLMAGYLQLAAEIADQIDQPPTHVLLQAGVGGMAAAIAAHARATWRDGPAIIVVEPSAAPALQDAIAAGRVVDTAGPVSTMGRLDCKTASMIGLAGLARDADLFVTIDDDIAQTGVDALTAHGLPTTPSGAAGVAALLAGIDGIGPDARVLAIVTEGATDP